MRKIVENFDLVYSHIKNDNDLVEDLVIQTEFGTIRCASGSDYYNIDLNIEGYLLDKEIDIRIEKVRHWVEEFNVENITFDINAKHKYSSDFIENIGYIFYQMLSNTCVKELAINNLGLITEEFKFRVDETIKLTDIHQDGEYSDIKIEGISILGFTVNTSVNSWNKVKKILENPLISMANIECIMDREQIISDVNSKVADLRLKVNRDIGKVISALNIKDALFVDVKEIENWYTKIKKDTRTIC